MSPRSRLAACLVLVVGCSSESTPQTADAGDADGSEVPVDVSAKAPLCVRSAKVVTRKGLCNGYAKNCARKLSETPTIMTHNAMSSEADKFVAPNQALAVKQQLEAGVRGLMLDVHYRDPESGLTVDSHIDGVSPSEQVYLCHGNCQLGRRPLFDTMCEIAQFLDSNPEEVLSIIYETYVSDPDLVSVLKEVGLESSLFTLKKGADPTLAEIIDSGKRLIVFNESGGGDPAYLHKAWAFVQDTPYTFAKSSDFNCNLNRGSRDNPLVLVNHWIGKPLADRRWAEEANTKAVIESRWAACEKEAGRAISYFGLDFFDVGAGMGVLKERSER